MSTFVINVALWLLLNGGEFVAITYEPCPNGQGLRGYHVETDGTVREGCAVTRQHRRIYFRYETGRFREFTIDQYQFNVPLRP